MEKKLHFLIYTIEGCPYCETAISLLENLKFKYPIHIKEQKIKNLKEKQEIKKINNMPTFPQIFISYKHKEKLIGGLDQLKDFITYLKTKFNSK
jgi:glutaredoxin